MQIELVCNRFPQLASLPLDRSSYFTAPVKAFYIQKAKLRMGQLFTDNSRLKNYNLLSIISKQLIGERLYYPRVMNFDNAMWKTVRKMVPSNQNMLDYFFNREVVNVLLPKPDINVGLNYVQSSSLKLLLGFSLWLKDHNFQKLDVN